MKFNKKKLSSVIAAVMVLTSIPLVFPKAEAETTDALINEDFENIYSRSSVFLTGYAEPRGWEFVDARSVTDGILSYGVTTSEHASGDAALALQAVNVNSAGYMSPKIKINNETPGFDINVKVKMTEDYLNNRAMYILRFYSGDYEVYTLNGQNFSLAKGEWCENNIHIDYSSYPEYTIPFDSVSVQLTTAYNGKNKVLGQGMIYFDDFSVTPTYDGNYTVLDVRCDRLTGWYNLGDVVTFKPVKELPDMIREVKVVLKNSYSEVIYETILPADEFETKGWVYTPTEWGHYTVSFTGVTDRGDIRIVTTYRNNTKNLATFVLNERSFVVAKETKPLEERNTDLTYASQNSGHGMMADDPAIWDEIYEMHNLIGFTGIRWHSFPWQPEFSADAQPNPGKGMYDWSGIDKIFENITRSGLSVWPCVILTPEWASTFAGADGTASAKVQSLTNTRCAPPTRIEYYTEYLTQVANRYGEDIDMWEIWCETTPRCAYFKNGTVEDYMELLSESYKHLKQIQPEDDVYMGGMIRNNADYYAKLLDAGLYDCTDAILIHQRWPDYENYYAEEEKRGLGGKPWINGEAHYNLLSTEYGLQYNTEREQAFDLLTGYFWDIREDVEKIALFQLCTQYDIEALAVKKSFKERGLALGLWRRWPFPEPRLCAIALHTFFDVMGKEFDYVGEHFLENEVKIMEFTSDGEPLAAVWHEYQDTDFPEALKACFTENTSIIDWENKEVSPDEKMRQNTIYFIRGYDAEAMKKIEGIEKQVLVTRRVKEEQVATEIAYGNKEQLFDEKTFKVTCDNINWNDTDWTWREKVTGETQGTDKARFAVSANDTGIFFMLEVDDNVPFFENDVPSQLYQADSVQLAIDVTAQGYSDMRCEIDVGRTYDDVVVFKRAAADIFGAIPADWSDALTVLDSKYGDVSVENGKTIYKLFIPTSELFPYDFELLNNELRLAIAFNDNDGNGRRGQMLWADGIDGGKFVGKYGKIILR